MKEFKGTKGKIRRFNNRVEQWGQYLDIKICDVSTGPEFEANINLIVDAFNVRQQINCDLPELLERHNKMLSILQDMLEEQDKIEELINEINR